MRPNPRRLRVRIKFYLMVTGVRASLSPFFFGYTLDTLHPDGHAMRLSDVQPPGACGCIASFHGSLQVRYPWRHGKRRSSVRRRSLASSFLDSDWDPIRRDP